MTTVIHKDRTCHASTKVVPNATKTSRSSSKPSVPLRDKQECNTHTIKRSPGVDKSTRTVSRQHGEDNMGVKGERAGLSSAQNVTNSQNDSKSKNKDKTKRQIVQNVSIQNKSSRITRTVDTQSKSSKLSQKSPSQVSPEGKKENVDATTSVQASTSSSSKQPQHRHKYTRVIKPDTKTVSTRKTQIKTENCDTRSVKSKSRSNTPLSMTSSMTSSMASSMTSSMTTSMTSSLLSNSSSSSASSSTATTTQSVQQRKTSTLCDKANVKVKSSSDKLSARNVTKLSLVSTKATVNKTSTKTTVINAPNKTRSTTKPATSATKQIVQTRTSRSRSNTPGSSVSSESTGSAKSNQSVPSRASSNNSNVSRKNVKTKSENVTNAPDLSLARSATFVKDETNVKQSHSYMRTTQSTANRNSKQPPPNNSTMKSVPSDKPTTETVRTMSNTKSKPVRPVFGSTQLHRTKSRSTPVTSSDKTKRNVTVHDSKTVTTGKSTQQVPSQKQSVVNECKQGSSASLKKTLNSGERTDSNSDENSKESNPINEQSTVHTSQPIKRKSSSVTTKDNFSLKSNITRTSNTGKKTMTSQKVTSGKSAQSQSKKAMIDKRLEPKPGKSVCLQDSSKNRSSRSTSKEREPSRATQSTHNAAVTGNRSEAVSSSEVCGPVKETRELKQSKPSSSTATKLEHKSKLIAPLPRKDTSRLPKVSKRDLNNSSVTSADKSKIKPLKTTQQSRVVTETRKNKSDLQKSSNCKAKKDTVKLPLNLSSNKKKSTGLANAKCSSPRDQHGINAALSDNTTENKKALERYCVEDTSSENIQICEFCSGARAFSNTKVVSGKRKLCHCSPISQNHSEENNQCRLSEKMELSETCYDSFHFDPGSAATHQQAERGSEDTNMQVSMETESADSLECNKIHLYSPCAGESENDLKPDCTNTDNNGITIQRACEHLDQKYINGDETYSDKLGASLEDSVIETSINMDYNSGDLCRNENVCKGDNSSGSMSNGETVSYSAGSLYGSEEGKICQPNNDTDTITQPIKIESSVQSQDTASLTDSGFFTNENSRATSFVSSASKSGEDLGSSIKRESSDSYEEDDNYRAIKSDHNISNPCSHDIEKLSSRPAYRGDTIITSEISTDHITQNDPETSHSVEISTVCQEDKKQNLANILIYGVQDLNSNCSRNVRVDSGCISQLDDSDDRSALLTAPSPDSTITQAQDKTPPLEPNATSDNNSQRDLETDIPDNKTYVIQQNQLCFQANESQLYMESSSERFRKSADTVVQQENNKIQKEQQENEDQYGQNDTKCDDSNETDNIASDLQELMPKTAAGESAITNTESVNYSEENNLCSECCNEADDMSHDVRRYSESDHEIINSPLTCDDHKNVGSDSDHVNNVECAEDTSDNGEYSVTNGLTEMSSAAIELMELSQNGLEIISDKPLESGSVDLWTRGDGDGGEDRSSLLDYNRLERIDQCNSNDDSLCHNTTTEALSTMPTIDTTCSEQEQNINASAESQSPYEQNLNVQTISCNESESTSGEHEQHIVHLEQNDRICSSNELQIRSLCSKETNINASQESLSSNTQILDMQTVSFKESEYTNESNLISKDIPQSQNRKSTDSGDKTWCEEIISEPLCGENVLHVAGSEPGENNISGNSEISVPCLVPCGDVSVIDLNREESDNLINTLELVSSACFNSQHEQSSLHLGSKEINSSEDADLEINPQTPQTITANVPNVDPLSCPEKPCAANIRPLQTTHENYTANVPATLSRAPDGPHERSELTGHTCNKPGLLKTHKNTLHETYVGEQIKNDNSSINMNEKLKLCELTDLSSPVDNDVCRDAENSGALAREVQQSRDSYSKHSGDSTGTGVIEINNHIMNQDFLKDQMSGLSEVAQTTQESSCGFQVCSEKISEPHQLMLSHGREELDLKCGDKNGSSVIIDDLDTYNGGPGQVSSIPTCGCSDNYEFNTEIKHKADCGYRQVDWRRHEQVCALGLENTHISEVESFNNNFGLCQGAEIISECVNVSPLQCSVVYLVSEASCDCDVHQTAACVGAPGRPQLTDSGVQHNSSLHGTAHLSATDITNNVDQDTRQYDSIIIENKVIVENKLSYLDKRKTSELQETFRFENNKLRSNSVPFNLCRKLTSEDVCTIQNKSAPDISSSLQNLPENNSSSWGNQRANCELFKSVSNESFSSEKCEKIRQTSIDLGELRLHPSKLLKLDRNDRTKQIRNKNFESETESGESGSTESGSNTAELEFTSPCIQAEAGEALCDSLSPTEVASILDDTSDSYVDATDTLEYDSDGEGGAVIATLLSQDKRQSGEYNVFNVCDSTSTESFQDAVETFDEGRHILLRSPDLTLVSDHLEDEDSLSQISLPLSDASTDSSTSLETLNFLSDIGCTDDICQQTTEHETMEGSGQRKTVIRENISLRSSLKHVQTSEYRTKTVLKDNLYRRVASSSLKADRLQRGETNVLRLADTNYESGNQIIKNVIYNSGNRVRSSVRNATQAPGATSEIHDQQGGHTEGHGQQGCYTDGHGQQGERACTQSHSLYENSSEISEACEILRDNEMSTTSEGTSENVTISVSPSPDVSDRMNHVNGSSSPVDVNIGLKIETALTIRTERRRQRQRQIQRHVTGISDQAGRQDPEPISGSESQTGGRLVHEPTVEPDTPAISQECAERLADVKGSFNEVSKIAQENSSTITQESNHLCVDGVGKHVKTNQQNTSQAVYSSTVVVNGRCFSKDNVLDISPIVFNPEEEILHKPTSSLKKVKLEDILTQTESDHVNVAGLDEPDCAFISNVDQDVSTTKTVATKLSENTGSIHDFTDTSSYTSVKKKVPTRGHKVDKKEEKTYRFYIKPGAAETDFDDIQFIDDEENGHNIENQNTESTESDKREQYCIDQTIAGPEIQSPNASFTIEFSCDEDSIDHSEIENVIKPMTEETKIEMATDGIIKQEPEIAADIINMNTEQTGTLSKEQFSSGHNTVSGCNDELGDEQFRLTNDAEVNDKITENKDTQLKSKSNEEVVPSSSVACNNTNVNKNAEHNDNALESDEAKSEIIEESHISVKDALKMEKKHLKYSHEPQAFRRGSLNRNSPRRATTENYVPNTCVPKSKSDDMANPEAPQRKPIKKSVSFRTEKEIINDDGDIDRLRNKRVSDICRNFVGKLKPVTRPTTTEEDSTKSGTKQRKQLMKWVRQNGKWLRIPVSDDDDGIQSPDIHQDKSDYDIFAAALNNHDDATDHDNNKTIEHSELSTEVKFEKPHTEIRTKESVNSPQSEIVLQSELIESSTEQIPKSEKETFKAENSDTFKDETDCCLSTSESNVCTIEENVNDSNDKEKYSEDRNDNSPEQDNNVIALSKAVPKIDDSTADNTIETKIQTTCETKDNTQMDTHVCDAAEYLSEDHIEDEVFNLGEDLSETRLQRQELLFGIRDNYNRRKLKKSHRETQSHRQTHAQNSKQKVDTESNELLNEQSDKNKENKSGNTDGELSPCDKPKTIPKLKAVKIQEEIFEGKPEYYTRRCNQKPSWSEEAESKTEPDVQKRDSKSKPSLLLRKSKTFSGIGDFDQKTREYLYVTSPNISATSQTSLSSSVDSLDQQELYMTHAESVESITSTNSINVTETDVEKTVEQKKQSSAKIPWYSSRKSRDKSKSDRKVKIQDPKDPPAPKSEKKRFRLPVFSRARSLQRSKLLSEIVEVEENKDDGGVQVNSVKPGSTSGSTSGPRSSHDNQSARPTVPRSNKRRSLSLPTGTLAFGEARIVYKNGHFTIETMDGTEIDSTRQTDQPLERQYSQSEVNKMLVTSDTREATHSGSRDTTLTQKPHMKRQCAKTVLKRNDSTEDVFYNDHDDEIENISPNSKLKPGKMGVSRLSDEYDPSQDGSERMDIDTDSDRSLSDKSCSSLPALGLKDDIVRETQRAKRTSSFRRAQERGLVLFTDRSESAQNGENEDSKHIESLEEEFSPDVNPSNSTFLQKMIAKRKSATENLGISSFTKQSESAKEFFAKKMTLKGLFKKNKSDTSVSSPMKTQHPVSPPIAAFQGDDDIGSIDTPPGSPFHQHEFRRRHTSADIYVRSFAETNETQDSNCPTPTQERSSTSRQSLSSPSTPSHETNSITSNTSSCALSSSRDEDQLSITSASSATSSVYSVQSPLPSEQPSKPKTPKPVGASPRRNPSFSSYRTGSVASTRDVSNSVTSLESDNIDNDEVLLECKCECDNRTSTLPRQRKYSEPDRKGSADCLAMCPHCRHVMSHSASISASNIVKLRKRSRSSGRHGSSSESSAIHRKDSGSRTSYEKLGIISQTEIASSNSNDSGIQRDVGVNSSNESIKGGQDGGSTRRESGSPPPERPKSEVGVRWADLDSTEFQEPASSPIKMRPRDQMLRDRPRPKSDFASNIELFDKIFGRVLEEIESEGSSFLSDRMRKFGSDVSLQPYCSLRNLYEMRKRDMDRQKDRRMSTPHPIKSRLPRVPRKLQKQPPLVRSSSLPENLNKLSAQQRRNCFSDNQSICPCRNIDMDESDDSDHSIDQEEDNLTYAEALWDHITMDPEELGFRAQDVIEVSDTSDKDWWFGGIEGRQGWFPAAFVRLRVNQDQIEDEIDLTRQESLATSPKLHRISMLNKNQARTNVVNEIIGAEREYVKHLEDVIEGYIPHARKRKDMFPDERIELIFGNIEEIYKFACKFLAQLEMCIDECPHLSEIGQCFLDNDKGFEIYSDYCNNHPSACEELKELCRDSKYTHFFEGCRLLQDLAEIPLEGFLLTPVQKICKYPLQLAELLKYTPPEHRDFQRVTDALAAMRKIATLINERKRKMESIEKIARWQQSVVDWEGSDLLEKSSELIFSGDANKINSAGWSQERYFFLFDHQLIYCKKEFLKRHVFNYKGRIDLDNCDIIDVPDGKDSQYNVSVKHAWKLHEIQKDKWYLLYAKSQSDKDRWMKALNNERKRVQEDKENDFSVPDHWKQTILNKIKTQSNIKDKHPVHRGPQGPALMYKDFTYSTLPRRPRNQKDDKKKGWNIFGGGKKSKR